MRQRRYRHNFHSFALSDKEEDLLIESKKIMGQGLIETLMSALKAYIKNNTQEKEDEPKSHLELIREFFFTFSMLFLHSVQAFALRGYLVWHLGYFFPSQCVAVD